LTGRIEGFALAFDDLTVAFDGSVALAHALAMTVSLSVAFAVAMPRLALSNGVLTLALAFSLIGLLALALTGLAFGV